MNSNKNILLTREYKNVNQFKKQNMPLSFNDMSQNNAGSADLDVKLNNTVYRHLTVPKMRNNYSDVYFDGEDNEDSKLIDLEIDQFYDINNLPPSLSVAFVQRENNECDLGLELRKTIMVGSDYQATIPDKIGSCDTTIALPYKEEDKLLWNPHTLSSDAIEDYLVKSQQIYFSKATGVAAIPRGSHTRDDEQALYVLLQQGCNIEEALEKQRLNNRSDTNSPPLWTEEECRNFESGIRVFGKDFYLIHSHKVRSRTVGDLVQFYYLWKKTERYDSFANRAKAEKRRSSVSSGGTLSDQRENVSPLKDLPFTDVPNCIHDESHERSDNDPIIENSFMRKLEKRNNVFNEVDDMFDIYAQQIQSSE